MTLNIRVTDDQFGAFHRKVAAIADRLDKSLPYESVMDALQRIHDGQFAPESPAVTGLQRNRHGHVIFTITGLDLAGAQEIERLEARKYRVSGYAKSMLRSKKDDSYDACHRLIAERSYAIAIVPGTVISRDRDRTTANLQKRAAEFGYEKPLAGIMPRIREAVSDEQMKEMHIWYIAALHDPITDSGGGPDVLRAHRFGAGRWLYAHWDHPDDGWDDYGAFAFLVPAS